MKKLPLLALGAVLAATSAFAQTAPTGPDLSTLTDSVVVDTVIAAVLAIGAAGVGIRLAWVGVKYVRKLVSST